MTEDFKNYKRKGNRTKRNYKKPPECVKGSRIYLEDETLLPYLALMMNSFDKMKLSQKKIPADSDKYGRKKWQNAGKNPEWYRKFSENYETNRTNDKNRGYYKKHFDTKIRRRHVKGVLAKMILNRYSHSIYANELIGIAEHLRGLEEMSLEHPEFSDSELDELNGISRTFETVKSKKDLESKID